MARCCRARMHSLNGQQQRLLNMSTTNREDWLMAEAEYLLRLANQRVLIERSATSAVGLLESADAIMEQVAAGLGDPELFAIRRAIAQDLAALRLRDAPVMRAHEVLTCRLVQPVCEPLAQAAAVHEHDRRAMCADHLDQARIHGRPDAVLTRRFIVVGEHKRPGARLIGRQHLVTARLRLDYRTRHVIDRDDDLKVERGRSVRVDDADRTITAKEPRDFRRGPCRGGQTDPLRVFVSERGKALERQRQVRAALRRCHRVHLVDDHPADRAQRLARLGPEDQVQRFRRRDEDLRRVLRLPAAILLAGELPWVAVQPDGGIVIQPPLRRGADEATEDRTFALLRYPAGSAAPDTIGRSTLPASADVQGYPAPGWFRLAPAVGADGALMLAGEDARYRVKAYDAAGDHVAVICRDAPAEPLSPWERGDSAPEDFPSELLSELRSASRPDTLAAIGRIFLSVEGGLWVQRARPSLLLGDFLGVPGSEYDIFDPDGRFLGSVRAPDRVTLQGALGDTVFAFATGELDETEIVAYRLALE